MKKQYLILVVICMSLLLTACGLSTEEIATYMTSLDASYQNGTYEQAMTEVKKLDKAYKKMTDEQKVKFDELKPLVEYASASVGAINEGLNNAQSFYEQKMYYEASQELEKVSTAYTLPPAEQKVFDEKKVAVDLGIKAWKITEALQKAEAAYNVADYDTATNELATIDIASLSEGENQVYISLQTKIEMSKRLLQAESELNACKYETALKTLSSINTEYLSTEQIQKHTYLKETTAHAKAKADNAKLMNAGISEAQAKSIALQQISGSVNYVRSTTYSGTDVYSVNIMDVEGYERSVIIDKKTGGILTIL